MLFHGFNSGPEQWTTYVEAIVGLGYDVFVPSLPGHGLVDAEGRDVLDHIPTASRRGEWKDFEDQIFRLARPAGKVTLVGLSLGGLLALRVAERYGGARGRGRAPIVQQVIAVAPLVAFEGDYEIGRIPLRCGHAAVTNQWVASKLAIAESIVGEPVDRLLRGVKVDMKGSTPAIDAGARFVGQDIVLGLTFLLEEMRANATALHDVPTRFIVTEADRTVSCQAALALAEEIGADRYVFPRKERAPHELVSPDENKAVATQQQTRALILGWLARERTPEAALAEVGPPR